MYRVRYSATVAMVVAGLLAGPVAASAAPSSLQSPPKADNTAVNKKPGTTADQQSQAKADLDLTKRIREALMKDTSLSTYAHNAKVIARQGAVTLRGPVRSSQEKQQVQDIATQIAGAGKVTNALTISTKKK